MNVINNSEFIGVKWDAQVIETIQTVAQALLNLTELFKSQHIEIECLLKIESQKDEKEND